MYELRASLRSWTRTLMADRETAEHLTANEPNPSFEDLVARQQAKGRVGDEIYEAIIASATRSRPSVNESLGIDPENPPPRCHACGGACPVMMRKMRVEPMTDEHGLTPLRYDQSGLRGKTARVLVEEPTDEIDWPADLPAGIRTVVILDDEPNPPHHTLRVHPPDDPPARVALVVYDQLALYEE